jgi:23S rRNA pseudouridine1911/1915/1917 synthase
MLPYQTGGTAGAECSAVIESSFRPYGKGRKEVRPLSSGRTAGALYRTELKLLEGYGAFSGKVYSEGRLFRVILRRGFRHQIRCHLAWIGRPLLNDRLYGGEDDGGFLALKANALYFNDPVTGKPLTIRLPGRLPGLE